MVDSCVSVQLVTVFFGWGIIERPSVVIDVASLALSEIPLASS